MHRQLRLQYAGALYHLMSRGNRRKKIVVDDVDRQDFIKALAEACQKTRWQLHACCLMPNHYHLVIETRIGLGTSKGANADLHRYMHQSLAPDSNPAHLGL
jgi:REP element-mobilizing transposase RayT